MKAKEKLSLIFPLLFLVFSSPVQSQTTTIAALLPPDTLLYAKIPRPHSLWKKTDDFTRGIGLPDIHPLKNLFRTIGMGEALNNPREMEEKLGIDSKTPIEIAVMGPGGNNLLFSVGLKDKSQFNSQLNQEGKSTLRKYRGLSYRIKSSPRALYCLTLGDRAYLFQNEENLKKVIDVYVDKKDSLYQQPNFQEVKREIFSRGDLTLFFNAESFIQTVPPLIEKRMMKTKPEGEMITLQLMQRAKAIGVRVRVEEKALRTEVFALMDTEEKLSSSSSQSPAGLNMVRYLPSSSFYGAWGIWSPETMKYFNQMLIASLEEAKKKAQDSTIKKKAEFIEFYTRLLEDTISAYTGEWVAGMGVGAGGFIPDFVKILRVKDKEVASRLTAEMPTLYHKMQKAIFAKKDDIIKIKTESLKEEVYEGIKINGFKFSLSPAKEGKSLPLQEIELRWAFTDDYEIIGSGKSVKEVLDLFRGKGESLLEVPSFKETLSSLPSRYNMAFYFSFSRYLESIIPIISQNFPFGQPPPSLGISPEKTPSMGGVVLLSSKGVFVRGLWRTEDLKNVISWIRTWIPNLPGGGPTPSPGKQNKERG